VNVQWGINWRVQEARNEWILFLKKSRGERHGRKSGNVNEPSTRSVGEGEFFNWNKQLLRPSVVGEKRMDRGRKEEVELKRPLWKGKRRE